MRDGLVPELALDLALNELVVAAAKATGASAAAVVLARGDEMVCRATTGDHAPDVGIPIHTRAGLSGACLRSCSTQYCRDTESDERVDPDVSYRLGIRSILLVPIFEREVPVGIIEAFSSQPSAFSDADELHLQEFAVDCLRLRQLAAESTQHPSRKPEEPSSPDSLSAIQPTTTAAADRRLGAAPSLPEVERDFSASWETLETLEPFMSSPDQRRLRLDPWNLVLAALVTVATVTLIFLIASRMGWLRSHPSHPARVEAPQAPAAQQNPSTAKLEPSEVKNEKDLVITSEPRPLAPPASGGLVIYERGKVIYRSQPTPSTLEVREPKSAANGTHKVLPIRLAPAEAEARLRDRVEPEYPEDARAAGRSGSVTLHILVRKDGSVGSVGRLRGDSLLAEAAAVAVRNWHYEPYQRKGQARQFQTDVTLTFSLSK